MAEMVANKIHKESNNHTIKQEVNMLKAIRTLGPGKKNLVRFVDKFMFQDLSCLAFKMLDNNRWDLMKERAWMLLTFNEIPSVTHQLLVAFEALKGTGILHTDITPDNIMLVNQNNQPFRVNLIDFGPALPVSKEQVGMTMQACAYKTLEVTLGLLIFETTNMWGLGCVIAFLYFGTNLFHGKTVLDIFLNTHGSVWRCAFSYHIGLIIFWLGMHNIGIFAYIQICQYFPSHFGWLVIEYWYRNILLSS